MTADDFRKIALSLPDAVESAHMKHPDFRIGKKVFATLGYPDSAWGMVKLTLEQQEVLVSAEPGIFKPVSGAWGRRGNTQLLLKAANKTTAKSALRMAYDNIASK